MVVTTAINDDPTIIKVNNKYAAVRTAYYQYPADITAYHQYPAVISAYNQHPADVKA